MLTYQHPFLTTMTFRVHSCSCTADIVELLAGARADCSLVSALGKAISEDSNANMGRGAQTVGSRFSQQVRLLCSTA